jgi:hypothetical protein
MLEKCKGNCMMGCHNFIFSPPSLSIQEAQVGGCKTGHARTRIVWWPQAYLVKIEHAACPCLATPRMCRRSGRRGRPSAAFSCRSTTTPPRSTSPHPWTSFLCRAQASPSPEGEGRHPPPPAPFPAGMCPVEIELGLGRSPGRRFAAVAAVWRPDAKGAGGGGGGDASSRSMKSGGVATDVLLEPPPVLL